jgi:hypothetical protein
LTTLLAVSPIFSRSLSSTATEGLSSTSFWWRRWTEHSRSPRWIMPPRRSPKTWISTWRGLSMYFSTNTVLLPNAWPASLEASRRARATSFSSRTTRRPLPPPPPAALRRMG